MAIKNKYKLTYDLTTSPKSRTWDKMKPSAQVSHDTGNPGSTALQNAKYFKSTTKGSSSAHTFSDDKEIRVIIPLDEKAWHVMYNTGTDNRIWGDDANDIAIGHELCYGGDINFEQAYDRWVWVHVYCAKEFNIPLSRIEGHFKLDPERRTDPINALSKNGKTWAGFLADVKRYFDNWEGSASTGSHKDEVVHTIAPGDTLWSIAREHDTTVDRLEELNPGIKATALTIGSKLTIRQIPAPKPVSRSKPVPSLPTGIYSEEKNGGKYSDGTKQIQHFLNTILFKVGAEDGYFGPKTTDALERFQSMYYGLTIDGVFGPNTRSKMIQHFKNM